jgi:hypothetical protein
MAENLTAAAAPLVPEVNVLIYSRLFEVEVALRELIIDAFATLGQQSWRQRLPGDTYQKFKQAQDYRLTTGWSDCIPHHPIYYLDFPDLRKVIERADNWSELFQSMFRRKDIVAATLSELEPIRNDIAHNRQGSARQLEIVIGAQSKLSNCVGPGYFASLAGRCTSIASIPEELDALRQELVEVWKSCAMCSSLTTPQWNRVRGLWWFDDVYLRTDLEPIKHFFHTMEQYQQLPRGRGSGHKIERWVSERDLSSSHDAARRTLVALVDQGRPTL